MSIEQFTKDMDIISKLPDEPNDVGGLTAAELKAKFDEGGKALKQYINAVVYPAISGRYTGDLDLEGNRLVNVGAPVQDTDAVRKAELDALTAAHEGHTHTAADVGAAPAEHTHTPADLGAAEAEHTHTAADVGALPAVESDRHPGCWYCPVDGVIRWINPPMVAGEEYCTTGEWSGKKIYCKRIMFTNTTALGGSASVNIPHGIENLNFMLTAHVTTYGYLLPYVTASTSLAVTAWDDTNLVLSNGGSSWDAGRKWYVEMRYLKND